MTNSSNSIFDLKGPGIDDYNSHVIEIELVSVSQALRRHSGRMRINGIQDLVDWFNNLEISLNFMLNLKIAGRRLNM